MRDVKNFYKEVYEQYSDEIKILYNKADEMILEVKEKVAEEER